MSKVLDQNDIKKNGALPREGRANCRKIDPNAAHINESLSKGSSTELPDFPIEVFPGTIQKIGTNYARLTGGSALELAMIPLMATICFALGPKFMVKVKSFVRSAKLWLGLVAPPGSAKTPTANALYSVLFDLQEQAVKEYRDAVARDEERAKQPELKGKAPKPTAKEKVIVVTDSTPEALVRDLSSNPEGLIFVSDELAQMFHSLDGHNKSGSNKGRSTFLGLWNHKQAVNTRRKTKPDEQAFARDTHLNVCGGIQPSVLRKLNLEDNDGLCARFCFSFAKCEGTGLGADLPQGVKPLWEKIFAAARAIGSISDPMIERIEDREAIALIDQKIREWRSQGIALDEAGRGLAAGFYSKCPDQLMRSLALLRGLDIAHADVMNGDLEPVELSLVKRAIRLTEYFLAHGLHAVKTILGNEGSDEGQLQTIDQRVVAALLRILSEPRKLVTKEWSRLLAGEGVTLTAKELGLSFTRIANDGHPQISIGTAKRSSAGKRWIVTPKHRQEPHM